jgi:hypothetical protein
MHRTQIYFHEREWGALKLLALREKITVSELIRKAVRRIYLANKKIDFLQALDTISGLWSNRSFETDSYIRALRNDHRL